MYVPPDNEIVTSFPLIDVTAALPVFALTDMTLVKLGMVILRVWERLVDSVDVNAFVTKLYHLHNF